MRTERKPGNERSEQEGASVKPREAEGSRVVTVWAQKQEAWLAGAAGGQRCSCIIFCE